MERVGACRPSGFGFVVAAALACNCGSCAAWLLFCGRVSDGVSAFESDASRLEAVLGATEDGMGNSPLKWESGLNVGNCSASRSSAIDRIR